MLIDHFPMYGLRLRTPRLELRLPDPEELAALAELAAEGVHDPATMPFTNAWTDQPAATRARGVLLWHWKVLSSWLTTDWTLPLAVLREGEVIGTQDVGARRFATVREVSTGSWLGRRHHGRGYGTEMRAAVLHLAFAGLDAIAATSGAYDNNPASLAVSRKLGYAEDGIERHSVRGKAAVLRRMRLGRDAWERHRAVDVDVEGLPPCLPLMGLT